MALFLCIEEHQSSDREGSDYRGGMNSQFEGILLTRVKV